MAEIAYPPSARPWEAEAKWAGAEPGMTLEVLRIINETGGKPWTVLTQRMTGLEKRVYVMQFDLDRFYNHTERTPLLQACGEAWELQEYDVKRCEELRDKLSRQMSPDPFE